MEATAEGDLEKVLALMDEDVVFLVPGQSPMRGRAAFAAASKAMSDQQLKIDGRTDVQEIQVFGEWAYCWNKLTVTITSPSGGTLQRDGHTLSVLKRGDDDRWVIFRDANLLGPPSNQNQSKLS